MELYNVMGIYVLQNRLLILGYKPLFHHGSSFLHCCTLHYNKWIYPWSLLPCRLNQQDFTTT